MLRGRRSRQRPIRDTAIPPGSSLARPSARFSAILLCCQSENSNAESRVFGIGLPPRRGAKRSSDSASLKRRAREIELGEQIFFFSARFMDRVREEFESWGSSLKL